MENFVALSPADHGNFSLAYNLSSVVSLASDNSTENMEDNGYIEARFNPVVAIIIMGLFSFVFFVGFCYTCLFGRSTSGEGSRAFRREMVNDNVRIAETRGLERIVIESFPVFSYDLVKGLKAQAKGSECPVCLGDFEDDEMVRLLPKCNHAFHPECIDMWLCSHNTCPVCRTSLVPTDEPSPSGTAIGVVEEQAIDDGAVRIDISNDEATDEAPEASHGSVEHSLVRVRKESEESPEWYIATAEGLKPGLHRSCSLVEIDLSEGASTSRAAPSFSKPDGSTNDPGSRSNSERRGSIPASFLRTFSERAAPRSGEQGGIEQPDRRAYFKRTVSWLTGRERGRDRGEPQRGSRSGSSRHVNQSSPNVVLEA
ncbi:hypothetical protein SUGI_0807810 [Cryptomeria japonica]|uniref:putative RING-H2 finger protein ATL35 n=1 Tax=Cryptomeria japonica TaxID=3369 RepID=UPI0024149CA7|nr:putative RING-H2 finger protein ATL35 [Cryptomeria japonica]GLJ39531.1 hypothetical protein SUGI_0807810 [Cryptomeria japonica]